MLYCKKQQQLKIAHYLDEAPFSNTLLSFLVLQAYKMGINNKN